MEDEFEWDPAKASANLKKHRVSFDDAKYVFRDLYALTVFDLQSPPEEDRYITVGSTLDSVVLVVASTFRGDRIRIISARKAKRSEKHDYEARKPRK
jgi:uncharacterized DUF497 family protein